MTIAVLDDALKVRQAGADLLSLALIDSRNHLLAWLAAFEGRVPADDGGVSPLWLAGHAGWFQEFWIARHVQRGRGEQADRGAVRLASVEPRADGWFGPGGTGLQGLDGPEVRSYLADTLETTLDLLAGAGTDDQALHFYRLALLHEDRLCEALAECAAAWQLPAGGEQAAPWRPVPARPARAPLLWPAQRAVIGSAPGCLVPENERWAHEVAIPEFEIDAQAVSWARFVEFAEDGGYDEPQWWTPAGWAWVQATGRRAPRFVEQMRGGVLLQRHGHLQRVAGHQAAVHLTRHEAEAWCRWAGRRLPTEPEWELAAATGGPRGFAWGDVFEWVAGSARAWPGHDAEPSPTGSLDRLPAPGAQGVLRGASWLSRRRCALPQARRFMPPAADAAFCGFRSCAL